MENSPEMQSQNEVRCSSDFDWDYQESGILNLIPLRLQEKIVDEIIKEKFERATDIWFEDERSRTVWVKRYDIQWNLTNTASQIWIQIGEKSVQEIVDDACEKYPQIDPNLIRLHYADFLLTALVNKLVVLRSKGFTEED